MNFFVFIHIPPQISAPNTTEIVRSQRMRSPFTHAAPKKTSQMATNRRPPGKTKIALQLQTANPLCCEMNRIISPGLWAQDKAAVVVPSSCSHLPFGPITADILGLPGRRQLGPSLSPWSRDSFPEAHSRTRCLGWRSSRAAGIAHIGAGAPRAEARRSETFRIAARPTTRRASGRAASDCGTRAHGDCIRCARRRGRGWWRCCAD